MGAVSLRVGYRTDTLKGLSALAGFTTGIGLHLWGQEFDYAWAVRDLGAAQYFSLVIHFGAPAEKRRNLIQLETIKIHRTARADSSDNGDEEDAQQMMQLLQAEDVHQARANPGGGQP